MASVSVSHLIIFIAAMLVAASVAGLLTSTVEDISTAIEEQGFSTSDEIRSEITIINDPGSDVYNDTAGELELFVKNTGTTELSTGSRDIDILVNGIFIQVADTDIEVLSAGNNVWGQSDVVKMNVTVDENQDLNAGENRVKIVADGAEDIFSWER
jgi:flagellar protein FlaG